MNRRPRRRWPRWLAAGLCAGGLGCSGPAFRADYPTMPAIPAAPAAAAKPIKPVSHTEPAPPAIPAPKEIPITLDAVLRLAEEHNPRIAQAREKLHESHLTMEQGSTGWIPNVYAGIAYYRHEGGI